MTNLTLLIGLALTLSTSVTAQRRKAETLNQVSSSFTSGDSARAIPLEIDNNILFLRVSVNGSRPLRFIFDTGASVSVVNSELLKELKLKVEGQASGTATGGNIQVGLVNGVSLSVAGAEVRNQILATLALDKTPCVEFDGVIGYDFINQFIVEIDYPNSLINLYNPRTYVYPGPGKVVPLLIAGRRTPLAVTNILLEGGRSVVSQLEVDTGGDSAFVIKSPFVKKHGLTRSLSTSIKGSGVGAGGEQNRLVGRVERVQLGPFTLDKPVVNLEEEKEDSGDGEDGDGIVGGEVLRRFKVVLDYSHQRMMLEPNAGFKDPYEVAMSGIGFGSNEEDCKDRKVQEVEPNSPASAADLQVGDIITAIDDKGINDIPSNDFEQLWKQNGKEIRLTIKRGTEILEKRIILRRLI
ncbi:MAG TPA: aspartyl protease family protein [Pyrinomonadaceae bacterium]|nr:aspartyl protease family protein [Pyrinomonadaceae bacterium]